MEHGYFSPLAVVEEKGSFKLIKLTLEISGIINPLTKTKFVDCQIRIRE